MAQMTERMVSVPASRLVDMADVITDALADYHRYDGLDEHEEWLEETARRLRGLADQG